MEEMQARKQCGGVVPFVIGFLLACVVGWAFLPGLFYTEQDQPVRFSHLIHQEQGMDCESCHFYREDGSYAGLPTNEQCGECHYIEVDDPTDAEAVMAAAEGALLSADEANVEAEMVYLTQYAAQGIEVPWLIYQYQPDNVYFSHIAHDGFDCTDCHPDVGESDTPPPHYTNVIDGYSKQTMKMWQCEECHARLHQANACYVCHK